MNKILYSQSSFYLLQDGKKIKIANPEEIPNKYYFIERNSMFGEDLFDLPKELSVEVKPKNHAGFLSCCRLDLCNCGEKVAILSKSSSQKRANGFYRVKYNNRWMIAEWYSGYTDNPDPKEWSEWLIPGIEGARIIHHIISDKDMTEIDENRINTEPEVKSSSPEIPDSSSKKEMKWISVDDYLPEDDKDYFVLSGSNADIASVLHDNTSKITNRRIWHNQNGAFLHHVSHFMPILLPSPPTVAGTSTELKSDSVIPNNSEKPDFEKMSHDVIKYSSATVIFMCDKIWNDYVIPRDKTISDLRESSRKWADKYFGMSEFAFNEGKEIIKLKERVKELERNLAKFNDLIDPEMQP